MNYVKLLRNVIWITESWIFVQVGVGWFAYMVFVWILKMLWIDIFCLIFSRKKELREKYFYLNFCSKCSQCCKLILFVIKLGRESQQSSIYIYFLKMQFPFFFYSWITAENYSTKERIRQQWIPVNLRYQKSFILLATTGVGVFDISISHIDFRYIDTFWKYWYRYRYR